MKNNSQDGPNARVEQLLEQHRQMPDAAAAKALEDQLVARLSRAESNGRNSDTMAAIAYPNRDARKTSNRFIHLTAWAAAACIFAGVLAMLAIRPPGGDEPYIAVAGDDEGQTDQTVPDTDELLPPSVIENSEAFSMTSEITGRDYNITVALPDHYNNTVLAENRYPVVYVLNSPFFDDAGSAITTYTRIAAGITLPTSGKSELPKVIVVSITLAGDVDILAFAEADVASELDRFLSFVSQELIPRIDTRYRTVASADGRAIAGIGSYVANMVLIAMYTQTDMYSRYLAVSPGESAPGHSVRELDEAFAATNSTLPARLFISASHSGTAFLVERWHTIITDHNYEGFESKYVVYDNPAYIASSFNAIFEGLYYLFSD
jgi:hypothetical protein